MIDKTQFEKILLKWLRDFLSSHYTDYSVDVIVATSSISRLSDPNIKNSIPNYSFFDFTPHLLGILKHKKISNKVELAFLNRSISPISLKEIGEMQSYCRLANPIAAFLVSTKGLPQEINKLLFDDKISSDLLDYSKDKNITIFSWNEKINAPDPQSVFPIKKESSNG